MNFFEENPNWENDVAATLAVMIGRLTDIYPLPWDTENVSEIEKLATEAALQVFLPHREKMGDKAFGAVVLFLGEEAKRQAASVAQS